jgi:hypothetical protein
MRRGRAEREYGLAVAAQPATVRTRRAYCSALSSGSGEPLTATASRVDHWLLVEHRAAWSRDPLATGTFSADLLAHLRAQLAALPHTRLLLIKKPRRHAQTAARAFIAVSRPGQERLLELELEQSDDLRDVDIPNEIAGLGRATRSDGPLWIVCTHGKRDRCCALHGRPLYDALRQETDSAGVWQSTHVGGDRFAGNVVVLPHGLYYGRVSPREVAGLVAAHAGERIDLARYRGRSGWPFAVQAAEHALREAEGLTGIADLELVGNVRGDSGEPCVSFRTPDRAVHELRVSGSLAEDATYLTCDSAEPRRARRWRVTAHDVLTR